MKVCVLSSGSKGNTTYIESDNAKILIDLGNTSKYVKEKLRLVHHQLIKDHQKNLAAIQLG